jgi:hypothetical protein
VGDFSPDALLHTDQRSIGHNEYYVKPLDRIELSSPLYKSGASPQCFRGVNGGFDDN